MNMLIAFLIGYLWANATLDKSGHLMFVEYSIDEPTKDKGVIYVDLLFHYKGETYKVARHRYPEPITSIVDTFPWFSKDKWEGGDLEVVAKKADGSIERSYISEKSIGIKVLGYEPPKFEHEVNSALVKIDDGPDPYAWRMLGYDPGHTGYYPFWLYPPLDSLWILPEWGHPGSWITDVSGAAGHDMLFIPKSASQWNILTARDIETGEIIWQRVATANVMTTALSEGDSILFVGTVIGYTPWKDTTFYALDPFTGKFKWGKSFKTVQESPIIIDSFVYIPSFGLSRIFCVSYGGDSLWSRWAGFPSPVFSEGVVFHTAPDSVLNARDWLTGELLWNFVGSGWIFGLMAHEEKVVFSPWFDPLYAVNIQSGNIFWYYYDYINGSPLSSHFSRIYWGHGLYVRDTMYTVLKAINFSNGQYIGNVVLEPADTNKGRMARIVVTQDTLLWFSNCGRIYVLKDLTEIYEVNLPPSPAVFSGYFFPIAYRDKLIFAHEDFLIVYGVNDFGDTSEGQDSFANFALYNFILNKRNFIGLNLTKGGILKLTLYSASGARVWNFRAYFDKGKHLLSLPSYLPSGVYLLRYEISGHRGIEKILYLNQRR